MTRRRDPGLQISGRGAELDQIFHSNGLQVIGLQECRAKKARRLEGDNCLHDFGTSGCPREEEDVNCGLPKSYDQTSEMCVCNVRSQELLLASLELTKCRCFVLVFHAHPECAGEQERLLWWQHCRSLVQESAVDTDCW